MTRDVKIFAKNLESTATGQVGELKDSPLAAGQKLRIMPDAHTGAGCVIGTTLTYEDKICPNIVGVDIGCGMLTAKLGKAEINLPALDRYIKRNIPAGFQVHSVPTDETRLVRRLKCYRKIKNPERITRSLGTLGGGNHFIEISVDDEENKYLVIHTGSRNLGKQVAEIYQDKANRTNPYGGLSYVSGSDLKDYLHDMELTQRWASYNRDLIYRLISDFLYEDPSLRPDYWETVHNYVSHEDDTIRKGAIRAAEGEKVLIPLNMRDGSLICIGKGNPDWNYSAPHGAGRILSRSRARKVLDLKEFRREMKGVYTTTANRKTIDEAPMAYKDGEEIKELILPTVTIEKQIRPIYNFKAVE